MLYIHITSLVINILKLIHFYYTINPIAGLAQLVELSLYTRRVAGSSPASRTPALVVQWIEPRTSKPLM